MDGFFGFFEGDSPLLQTIGKWSYMAYSERALVQMYIHLIISSMFPIYIGSHASLQRPPSAATPKKSEDEDDDEIDVEPVIEGLTPSDAIMFPVMAGITLGGLYFIIKWLKDPAILNKILNWYFSGIGVIGVGKLAGDALHVATTFVFPSVWSSGKEVYYVEPLLSAQVTGHVSKARLLSTRKVVENKPNPFPGFLSKIKFSETTTKKLWSVRASLKSHWIFRGYTHGLFNIKRKVQLNDVFGLVVGVVAIVLYNLNGQTWYLTNLIGFGFCYGTLQIMSPTTFWTGTIVLGGLFIYDIVMVFYTPMMVTVATKLDVPIKLVFPGPGRGSMLGLGDVVLPGIVMALALRFDVYLHYLRQQKKGGSSVLDNDAKDGVITRRATYVEAAGQWGERFWTSKNTEKTTADGARFSKVYFKASLVGYFIAMLTTLGVMNIFKHAQPALLYLVPGVLISLWGTALVRGELNLMWEYTEDGNWGYDNDHVPKQEKAEEEAKELKGDGKKAIGESQVEESKKKAEAKNKKEEEHAHHVFLFSLSEPKMKKAKLI